MSSEEWFDPEDVPAGHIELAADLWVQHVSLLGPVVAGFVVAFADPGKIIFVNGTPRQELFDSTLDAVLAVYESNPELFEVKADYGVEIVCDEHLIPEILTRLTLNDAIGPTDPTVVANFSTEFLAGNEVLCDRLVTVNGEVYAPLRSGQIVELPA